MRKLSQPGPTSENNMVQRLHQPKADTKYGQETHHCYLNSEILGFLTNDDATHPLYTIYDYTLGYSVATTNNEFAVNIDKQDITSMLASKKDIKWFL